MAAVGIVLSTTAVAGCSRPGLIIVNDTDQYVEVRRTTNSDVLVVRLLPHQEQRRGLGVESDGCTPDAGYAAYLATGPDEITRGPALATLGAVCEGDTWTIRQPAS